MTFLQTFSVYIPDKKVDIAMLAKETQLSPEMRAIFERFYGLRKLAIFEEGGVIQMIDKTLLAVSTHLEKVDYIFYVHTSDWNLPYGASVLSYVKEKYAIHCAYTYDLSYSRCASYFSVWQLLTKIFRKKPESTALVLTGEIAFTPKLRVVPQSSLVSDAATAAIWTSQGQAHQLLAVVNYFIPGFDKGIYLSVDDLTLFDRSFVDSVVAVIHAVIAKAGLSLANVALILPHNVNIPTWDKIAEKLRFPFSRIFSDNISALAHTFCSDHLINLKSVIERNILHKEEYYVSVSCGLGFFISAAVFRY